MSLSKADRYYHVGPDLSQIYFTFRYGMYFCHIWKTFSWSIDVKCVKLDRNVSAISEDEFYDRGRPRANTKGSGESTLDVRLQSSPPSPQSLQPQPTYADGDPEANPHKKLTHVNSLSAPEVNKVRHLSQNINFFCALFTFNVKYSSKWASVNDALLGAQ